MGSKITETQKCRQCHDTYILTSPLTGQYSEAALCKCFPSPCKTCQGTRFLLEQDHTGREMAMPCPDCERLKRNIKIYNRARIPKNYSHCTLARSDRDKVNASIYDLLNSLTRSLPNKSLRSGTPIELTRPEKSGQGLVLMGTPGSGKTHLLAGFAYQCAARGITCMFQGFAELLSEIKSGYSEGKSEMEIIAPHLAAEVLIIDDLGKGRNNDWELSILDTLISARYNSNSLIMVTSNYTEKEETTLKERLLTKEKNQEDKFIVDTLRRRVGERIYSRLKEMCYFETLLGADRRLTNSEHDHSYKVN